MFIKLGELTSINLETPESSIPALDQDILASFQSTASALKRVAPKAEDFLYFSAVMMHAAEASAINNDGTVKLTKDGKPVVVGWDKSNNTLRWITSDSSIKPYKNVNGDIFPEEELIKAYRQWVGKPLCVDHKSSSVEHVRGFIVDTYYDRKLKRVVALCALDKAGYPQLARQVSTGVSTNVSMGTAVGRAICAESDCAVVARTENDFCQHMRYKSGYGEINVDLSPIELSIVVNGADPKANIKDVFAAANTLNAYVESKKNEINKVADYDATLYSEDAGTTIHLNEDNIKDFREAIEVATQKLEEIHSSMDKLTDSSESTTGVDGLAPTTPTATPELAPPHDRFASVNQLHEITKNIESQLSQMKESLEKLANNSTVVKDKEIMSHKKVEKVAYPQGTDETKKYPVDPSNAASRFEDKQMVGLDNLGGADGLVPGDLEKKKMLARAEEEQRKLRRAAVVAAAKKALKEKTAYPQGTEEPTTYPKDKGNEENRDKNDKQMVGKSPFPGVGKTDDLYPDDKKKKELLQRASLKAKFVRKAEKGESSWDIYSGDNLVLSASVNELSGGRSELMFDSIATKDFGKNLILKVRKEGAEKVSSLLKKAQLAPAPVETQVPAVEEVPVEEVPVNRDGDPATVIKDLTEKLNELSSDLGEAVNTLVGEVPEMGEPVTELTDDMVAAATNSKSMKETHVALGKQLVKAMRDSMTGLSKHEEELNTIAKFYENGSVKAENAAFAKSLTEDAVKEAKEAVADGFKLVKAFVQFARGSEALRKKADVEKDLETMDKKVDTNKEDEQLVSDINDADKELEDLTNMLKDLEVDPNTWDVPVGVESNDVFDDTKVAPNPTNPLEMEDPVDNNSVVDCETSEDHNDLKATMDELKNLGNTTLPAGTKVEVEASNKNVSTKKSRAAKRAELAAEAGAVELLQEAHPGGGVDAVKLDVKPEGDLAKIETLDETQKAMLDVVNAPPRVKKEAESLHKLVLAGSITESDFDDLIAEGLDAEAVAYYKKYYGEVEGGKEFAAELVKEHTKAEVDAQVNTFKVKLARAYELAYDMVDRGLVTREREGVTAAVNDIMKYNDEAFESMKRVVAKHEIRKEASMPQVGKFGSSDPLTQVKEGSLFEQLEGVFSTSKGRMF